jgi:hypothetical protein
MKIVWLNCKQYQQETNNINNIISLSLSLFLSLSLSLSLRTSTKRGRNICVWVAGGGRFQASLLPDFVLPWVIPVEARVSQLLGFVEF